VCGPGMERRLSDEDCIQLMLLVKEAKIKTKDGQEAECVVQRRGGGWVMEITFSSCYLSKKERSRPRTWRTLRVWSKDGEEAE